MGVTIHQHPEVGREGFIRNLVKWCLQTDALGHFPWYPLEKRLIVQLRAKISVKDELKIDRIVEGVE